MASPVVSYALDDGTVVRFEVEPAGDFQPVGAREIAGEVAKAIGPAVDAARVGLDRVREMGPQKVEVKFGIKANGTANWLVAKAAAEGNFEVTLTWGG